MLGAHRYLPLKTQLAFRCFKRSHSICTLCLTCYITLQEAFTLYQNRNEEQYGNIKRFLKVIPVRIEAVTLLRIGAKL
jgi:hypothetical protein